MNLTARLSRRSISFRTTPLHNTAKFCTPLRILIWAVALLSVTAGGSLALDHSGTVAASETWFAADNPHVVTGNVTVSAGVTLTLEPGVEVHFDASRRLTMQGDLYAVGTAGQPILFTRNSGSNWGYLYFLTTGGGTLDHCVIEYCSYGIYANSNSAVSLTNATVRNTTYGIYSIASNALVVSDCQFEDNSRGILVQGGTIDLSSTSFTANTAYGFYGIGVAPTFSDANITFDANGTGLRIDSVAGLMLTTPLTVTGSTAAGLHFDNCDGVLVDNQTLTGNTGAKGALFVDDCGEFTLGAGNTNGGAGLENSWPLAIGMGSFPAAATVIPAAGNTNNDIQVA
ncbi:MAG: NosD domain-containing protein, partial [Candidatus Krumholzibacteria bacterium]|nr:NosD domain-containing protein [Candidatus Krumholzibacteria bacterium]